LGQNLVDQWQTTWPTQRFTFPIQWSKFRQMTYVSTTGNDIDVTDQNSFYNGRIELTLASNLNNPKIVLLNQTTSWSLGVRVLSIGC